jgi:hypothetical protein
VTGSSREEPTSVAFLLSVALIFNGINRVLTGHNMKIIGLHPRKVARFFGPSRMTALKTVGVYSGKVCIGQIRRSIETRIKDHNWHMKL